MTRRALLLTLLVPVTATAQTMVLSGGTLTVAAGTTVSIDAALQWQLAPGAAVVNDGVIDLGTGATVAEQPGAPITGTGLERATWAAAAPLAQAEPGGLGLTLTTAYADGGLSVERGHLPRTAGNGAQGIARWYRIATPKPATEPMEALLHYDATELGGADAAQLALFASSDEDGPWDMLATSGDPGLQNLLATAPAPGIHLTAFDQDAVLHWAPTPPSAWRCWPTVVEDAVCISAPEEQPLRSAALVDANGRTASLVPADAADGISRLALPPLASGIYLLRINEGDAAFKLVKP